MQYSTIIIEVLFPLVFLPFCSSNMQIFLCPQHSMLDNISNRTQNQTQGKTQNLAKSNFMVHQQSPSTLRILQRKWQVNIKPNNTFSTIQLRSHQAMSKTLRRDDLGQSYLQHICMKWLLSQLLWQPYGYNLTTLPSLNNAPQKIYIHIENKAFQ